MQSFAYGSIVQLRGFSATAITLFATGAETVLRVSGFSTRDRVDACTRAFADAGTQRRPRTPPLDMGSIPGICICDEL